MIFKSKKDWFMILLVYGFLEGIFIYTLYDLYTSEGYTTAFAITGTIFSVITILLWYFNQIKYEVSPEYVYYKVGFVSGKIKTSSISKIIKNKTLWVGFKPANARNGIIITYNKYDEIYFSPESNDLFIEEVLKHNPTLVIQETK